MSRLFFRTRWLLFLLLSLLIGACSEREPVYQFTAQDIEFLRKFSLSNLEELPVSTSNAVADNLDAAKLGHRLFFDKRLSSNQAVACSNCHQPQKYFTDGLKRSKAIATVRRNSPSLLASPWSAWLFWDGRKDSLWAQALGPLEDSAEHNFTRVAVTKLLAKHYRKDYESIFGKLIDDSILNVLSDEATPLGSESQRQAWQAIDKRIRFEVETAFTNAGKSLMAYQRRLRMPLSPFDQFVDALVEGKSRLDDHLNPSEVNGLRLFVGKANCASCHNGPLLTNFEFHNIGAPEADVKDIDLGRYLGVKQLSQDEFTCLSRYSDAEKGDCQEMQFLKKQGPELVGAFKTPSLRNVAKTGPYMQMGQFDKLEQVIEHYNTPKPPYYDRKLHPNRPHFDILPLKLTDKEKIDLIAFLHALTSPLPAEDPWWAVPTES